MSRQEARSFLKEGLGGTAPQWVERALDRLLELGVAAERCPELGEGRDGLVAPLPGLPPLAQKTERLASRINS